VTILQFSLWMMILGRILITAIFLLNAVGIIDQSTPAKDLEDRGFPRPIVPFVMLAGRSLQFLAGTALGLGILPQLAAIFLLAFIVPATFISHAFWLSVGKPNFQGQLVNFFKNVAIWGALLFIAAVPDQPTLLHLHF
jgi:putative oxidoreductase